ncbi:NlpC/P60 family protein [Streptomyces sp. SCSIO ZS0520]|uniref:C40 family peptidase n=1 Tax=Streptomyces sp. SCSIO ZS0520 TaxID=2892996 RepID=UPI0021DB1758|nr:C40 family peptidase [Streptomyces sp. SCSIO ZS0520]
MGSHRRSPASPRALTGQGARVTVLSAAFATAATTLAAAPAGAAPPDSPDRARAEVRRLYTEAERATQAYNGAGEKAKALRTALARTQDRMARTQDQVNALREALAPIAGAQYRSGGLDPALMLLLSADPDGYLDQATTLDRMGVVGEQRLRGLRHARRTLDQERREADALLGELERSRRTLARHKDTVRQRLARAKTLLAALPEGERALDARASRSGRPDPGLPLTGAAASPHAAAALATARTALGSPYVWGANGPSRFDCSGLVQWSYARAGVGLPRTSQAQAGAGRRIPLSEARPGDLVVYRADASHIGLYAGGGRVIHAPYPGAPVRYDPVGMMPISSVTRV